MPKIVYQRNREGQETTRISWSSMARRDIEEVCEWAHLHGRVSLLEAARAALRRRDRDQRPYADPS